MNRKNKKNKEEENQEENKMKLDIHGDAKRSIAAVFLFVLSILFIFGFMNGGGTIGNSLNKLGGLTFGVGKWLFPVVMLASGVVLLLRKKAIFYITKILGFSLIFLSLLGFFHMLFDAENMLSAAQAGKGGGYIGYAFAILLTKLAGKAAGSIILISVFVIGIIVAFNVSLMHLLEKIKFKKGSGSEEEETEEDDEDENEDAEGDDENSENEEAEEEDDSEVNEKDIKDNISKIEFVEDAAGESKEKVKIKEYKKNPKTKAKSLSSNYNGTWQLPPLKLLESSSGEAKGGDIEKNVDTIQKTFHHFGIEVEPGEIKVGPTVTQYTFRPAVGVKLNRITSLGNDLALALAAHPIRIEAPIPNKSLIGIEVPNKVKATVRLKDLLGSQEFQNRSSDLSLALGQDVGGSFGVEDLSKMPHLLVAGATGTGKSVTINTILMSLLYQNSPEDLKFILVDPKRVELSLYSGIPHLLSDVIVENKKVINALKWAVGEMERRYRLLQDTGSRDLKSYEQKLLEGKKRKYIDPDTNEEIEEDLEKLPYIVIVIDELADLMSAHGKEVEGAIIRLAQMARAIGIHLIISTQRPSVEVLTGLIKANITTRISLQVATQIDSRTILDMGGAEKLLGNGDLLFLSVKSPKPIRLQGVYVSESEVRKVVNFIKKQKFEDKKEDENITESDANVKLGNGMDFSSVPGASEEQEDDLYEEAKAIVIGAKKASSSLLQRRLRVGYSRAARLIDMLEENGIVGPAEGSKPREILIGEGEEKAQKPEYENPIDDQVKRDNWQM